MTAPYHKVGGYTIRHGHGSSPIGGNVFVAWIPLASRRWSSPDRATRRWCHRAAGRARERQGERLQVRDRPIDAVARWRVWVDVGKKAFEVRPPLRTP